MKDGHDSVFNWPSLISVADLVAVYKKAIKLANIPAPYHTNN